MTIIKNPALFVAKDSGLALHVDKAISAKISPTQMAKGVNE